MRILIAEDTLESRELLTELLRNGGHTVTAVCNGREALAAIEKDQFEVVFMDEQMPLKNGLETARAIRERNRPNAKQPIIIGMSGNTAESDQRRCLEAGMDAFMPKPIGVAALLGLLAVLSRRAGTHGDPAQGHSPAPDRAHQLHFLRQRHKAN